MLRKSAPALILFSAVAGCSADPLAQEHLGRVSQPILGGTASDASQDAVVMIALVDPTTSSRLGLCTGALIAPRLVLTARHCVARADGAEVVCGADGNPLTGGAIFENYAADRFYVFTGRTRPAFIGDSPAKVDLAQWKPAGRASEIIDDKGTNLCNHDLALLLLEAPIDGVPLATLRLDGEAKAGEGLLTVGWGVTSGEVEPKERQQRSGVTVKRVGPYDAFPILTKNEFLFDESICLGDSGGPVFAASTNAIVGVVSRGGNGADPNAGGPASTCIQADNYATKVAPFRDLVLDGFRRAGAEPRLEPKEDDGCAVALRPAQPSAALLLGLIGVAIVRRRRKTH